MKQNYLKSLCLMLMMLVGMGAWADTVEFGWGTSTGTNFTATSGNISDILSFTTAKEGSTSNPAYNSTNSQLRLYYDSSAKGNGGSITITPATGITFSEIAIVSATSPAVKYYVDGSSTGSSVSASSNKYTISESVSSSIKIQNVNTSNTQLQITKIIVTYSNGKNLSSISVKTAPSKTTYTEGEFFDPANLVITKTFDDSSTQDVSYSSNASAFTFTPSLTTALQTTDASVQISVGGKSTTQNITVNAIPSHTAHFSVNGRINNGDDQVVKEGQAITFPADPSDIGSKKFQGWTKTADYSNATTAPSDLCKAADMGNADVTYYAVFAMQKGSATPQTVTWSISGVETAASGGNDVNTVLKTSSVAPSTETGVWTAVAKSSYAGTSSGKAQLGSGSYKFAGTITLSGTAIPSTATITGINLTATSTATDANPYTIAATVNGQNYGTADQISANNANCSWTDEVEGNVIVLTTACGYNKNILISAISVTYTDFSCTDYCTIVPSANITISAAGYTTYYNSTNAYVMPDDCEGYVFTAAKGLELAYEAEEIVPAGEPLVIYTIEPGIKTLVFTTSSEETYKENDLNDLDGTDDAAALAADNDYYFYGLTMGKGDKAGKVGFFWMNETGAAFTNGAHKAYLKLPKSSAVKGFSFEDAQTAVKAVEAAAPKAIYDLQGRKVNAAQKGLYIINGKKVVK